MADNIDFKELVTETRPRVYLLWAIITGVGYTTTHYYQNPNINAVWFLLSLTGLGYMYAVMPMKLKLMRKIFMSWSVPITFGIIVSVLAARTEAFSSLLPYLGAFWLLVTSVGFAWNGYVDPPSKWYYISAALCLSAGVLCYIVDSFIEIQYLVAGIVTVWSMLSLWLFRSVA